MSERDLKILDALGNETRLRMFKCLSDRNMHITKLAKELGLSIPVASKHVHVLEDANLIRRKVFGKTHVLSINNKNICKIDDDCQIRIDATYLRLLDTINSLRIQDK
jgi:DNA-binding transcriptional ArsR family regulator